jgi:hypothetical protein
MSCADGDSLAAPACRTLAWAVEQLGTVAPGTVASAVCLNPIAEQAPSDYRRVMKRIMTATTCSAAALALGFAPTAYAETDAAFLQQLTDSGISWAGETRPSDEVLVTEAHAVCSWKGSGITAASASQVRIDLNLTVAQANQFVTIAENAYCWG